MRKERNIYNNNFGLRHDTEVKQLSVELLKQQQAELLAVTTYEAAFS